MAHTRRGAPTINAESPQFKQDILQVILQYMRDEGYSASVMTIQDEANVKLVQEHQKVAQLKRMRAAIMEGDWAEVEKQLSAKRSASGDQQHRSFLYAIYREQYLELVEGGEYHKAFTHLTKRLKPLEACAPSLAEFKDLCYLLTCKSVQEVVRDWEGPATAREQLIEQFGALFELCDLESAELASAASAPPPQRLIQLLEQAMAHQLAASRRGASREGEAAAARRAAAASSSASLSGILKDYACTLRPNSKHAELLAHRGGVKCVAWLGEGGLLASGGNDASVRLWEPLRSQRCLGKLDKHSSRVWQLAARATGSQLQLASASADATVRLWDVATALGEGEAAADAAALLSLPGHKGDVYSVAFHPQEPLLLSGGYDNTVRLWDLSKGQLLRTLHGHELAVSSCVFNGSGNLIVSGAKDATIRFWDMRSGLCLKSLSQHLGEVTSIALSSSGLELLSCSKDNSVRLWDLRKAKPLRSFKGHQNTSKNFVRAQFGPGPDSVVCGSEDGRIYIWALESGELVQRLGGHTDIAYATDWNERLSLLASCSHDGSVRTWCHDPTDTGDGDLDTNPWHVATF